jgi:outer membrane protein assembly factor BamB
MRRLHLICVLLLVGAAAALARADDWPQWLGPKRDGVWRETGIIEEFPPGGPPTRWRAQIGGGYAGPAVANGRVYLVDRVVARGSSNPADPFQRASIPGSERISCFNERDGKLLWRQEYETAYTISYPAGPRATPLVSDGRVYTLGAEGRLHCLDTADGRVIWARDFVKDLGAKTPEWGFAGHPLLDGRQLICLVGAPDGVVMAFDKDNGRELWRALSAKEPGYCPPTMIEVEGRRQLVVWHPEAINGVDPQTGKVLWSFPWSIRYGLTIPTPRLVGDRLFLTAFYNGSLLLRLKSADAGVEVLWRGRKPSEKDTEHLHSIMPTPVISGDHIYGVCSYGQLRCLKLESGERLWETFAATTGKETRWGNAFLIPQGDRYFLFNELGDLIIARLTPQGYQEISRTHLLAPTGTAAGRHVVWSHPAFANRSIYVRNDEELVCTSLAAPELAKE